MRDKEIKNTKPKDLPIYGVVVTGKQRVYKFYKEHRILRLL